MSRSLRLSESEGREIFTGAYERSLRNCHHDALRRVKKTLAEELADLGPGARAFMMHEFAVAKAIKEFDGDPRVKVVDRRPNGGYFTLVFDDVAALRFKKYRDDSFRTCGIPTREQQRFALQEPPLPDFPTKTNLVAGYLLDELETSIKLIAISCSDRDELLWSIDITEDTAEYGNVVEFADPKKRRDYTIRSASEEGSEEEPDENRDAGGSETD